MGQIYFINFGDLEKNYIGSSVNFQTRKYRHLLLLKNNKHYNYYLQNAFNKYGEASFNMQIFEDDIPNEDLLFWEQACFEHFFYKDTLKPYYNICKFAGNTFGQRKFGFKHSEETKINLSKSRIGSLNPQFGNVGNLNPFYGKKHSEETKLKMSLKRKIKNCKKGHLFSDENTLYGKRGGKTTRTCRICKRNREKNYRKFKKRV